MPFSTEDAKFVADLRLKIIQNNAKNLAPEHGIEKEDLKRALEIIRNERSIGDATGSKAKAKAPEIPFDLDAFLKK